MQNQESLHFDQNVGKFLNHIFKNSLNGKGFAIRIVALIAFGYLMSVIATASLTTYMTNLSRSHDFTSPISPMYTFITQFMTVYSFLSLLISSYLVIRRVRDIVCEVEVWPYMLGAVILSIIPFVGYIALFLLMILPSGYLNRERHQVLLKKISAM